MKKALQALPGQGASWTEACQQSSRRPPSLGSGVGNWTTIFRLKHCKISDSPSSACASKHTACPFPVLHLPICKTAAMGNPLPRRRPTAIKQCISESQQSPQSLVGALKMQLFKWPGRPPERLFSPWRKRTGVKLAVGGSSLLQVILSKPHVLFHSQFAGILCHYLSC